LRYGLSGQKEDVDKCITHFTEAILLPPISVAGPGLNIVHLLFILASTLLQRSETFEQPDDVQASIKYLLYLRGLPLDSSSVPKNDVTNPLIEGLYLQVKLGSPDVTRNMEEMVALCRELLASDISTDFPTTAFSYLSHTICTALCRGRHVESVGEAIECIRDAVKVCPPHSFRVYLALACPLVFRFHITHSRNDYEEARALFEKVIGPNYSGENPDSDQVLALIGIMSATLCRAGYFGNPEYFEELISHCRSVLGCTSLPEDARSLVTGTLAITAGLRFELHGRFDDLQEANSYHSECVRILSSQSPAIFEESSRFDEVRDSYSNTAIEQKILDLKKLLSDTRPGTLRHSECLDRLARWYETKFARTNDLADIEESIKYFRLSLDAAASDTLFRPVYLRPLCGSLLSAFTMSNNVSYLDELIVLRREIVKLEDAGTTRFEATRCLVLSLLERFDLFYRIEDLNEVIRLMQFAVDDQYAWGPYRSRLSSNWAHLARRMGHPSASEAYKKAMALMQDSLSLSPTIQHQHDSLFAMGNRCKTIPLDYASYRVDLGHLEAAIETLEQGRALLWSGMRGLRTPISEPIEEDFPLAKKLAEINQELEVVTTSIAPSRRVDLTPGGDGMDAFGRLVVKQQKLRKERVALISQVQGRPGFERFWKTPSFVTLRSAASHGPVIIINHCQWRSDILIILSDAPPSLIPTPKDFFSRASKLRDQLLDMRNDRGLDSPEYELTLGTVLLELYQLVGKPVIQRLRELGIPEQSRIWWCPTSVFCSLPLHAMGPIPSTDDVNVKRYISDLFICSYTPTLSALIDSRSRNLHVPGRPRLLIVAQPDASLPDATEEISVVQSQRQVQVKSLISEHATSSAVIEGLRDHQLVHFACHSTL
jgi:tetratricopeptide (TPR) repeat protein